MTRGYFSSRSMAVRALRQRAVGLTYGQRALVIGATDPVLFIGTAQHTTHRDDGQQHLQLPVGGEHFVHGPQQQRLHLAPLAVQADGARQQRALGRLQLARRHALALQQRQRARRQRAHRHLQCRQGRER